MVNNYPTIAAYWDFYEQAMNPEGLQDFIAKASKGEAIMARFFAGVWLGQNRHEFDLYDAVAVLDDKWLKVIMDWVEDPFWP